MESKVSGLLSEAVAPEVQHYVFGPRLERDFRQCFPYLTAINQAHVLMLCRQGILPLTTGKALARALLELERQGPEGLALEPAREDAYFNYEAHVINMVGADIGGRMHIGRSRNDLKATIDRMRTRAGCLAIVDALLKLRTTTLERAERYASVLMPGYTHLQPAQPVTFGYYLLGIAQALERDHQRLASCYPRINLNPLGAGALAGTSFPIDRQQTRELLGFDGLVEHNLDAVASRDFAVELLAACAMQGLTWSRLAQDLYVMVTDEFRAVDFPDRVCGTSTIMPQKRNPVVLEHLKGQAAHLLGALMATMTAIKGTNFTNTIDGNTGALHGFFEALDVTMSGLAMTELVVATVVPNVETLRNRVYENFSTATELADALVREAGLSFREAHHIVGGVVRQAMAAGQKAHEISAELIEAVARAMTGTAVALSPESVSNSLDPAHALERRQGGGDPSRREVSRMIHEARQRLADDRREHDNRRTRLENAGTVLKADSAALAAGS